jgi:predicted transcriptional regulator of viral defense system
MALHKLTRQKTNIICLNTEQSKKTTTPKTLEQSRIDLAFKGNGRISQFVFNYENWEIYCISGKNTNKLGVEEIQLSRSVVIPATNIERTLIDIAVRPIYAGGVYEVLNAFKEAKDKFSVKELVTMLMDIDYLYPFHQAIGFYMECAGYNEADLNLLRKINMQFDFYLDYKMKEKEYSKNGKYSIRKEY